MQTGAAYEIVTRIGEPPVSPARTRDPERAPLRVGVVQQRFRDDPAAHEAALAEGVELAARQGATVVFLQELTLSPYLGVLEGAADEAARRREPLLDGPTARFAGRLARTLGIHVHASLYEQIEGDSERGFNTAICLSPEGELVVHARKLHIPDTPGYSEGQYFYPGDTGFRIAPIGEARVGFPTCWDQWFPEVARAFALEGADVIVYPTAIGSEPDHPGFDTAPLWQQVIRGNGIANGTFMVAINRIGEESGTTFYGTSFISDPYGRVLVEAPRDRAAVLVADLDLDQRRDWLELFPLLAARRPELYGPLTATAAPAVGS